MEKTRDFKVLSGFIIKIIAISFMTFDHIGYFMEPYENLTVFSSIFRIIGRLSFPLFIFLLVEGVIHTKNFTKYFIRLCILALAFLIGQLFYYFTSDHLEMLSPAVDLVLTAATVYLIKRKDKFSFFAIIPVAWTILTLVVRNHELVNDVHLNWCPFFLRPDYTILGPVLGIGFFFANELAVLFLKSNEGTKFWVGTTYERTTINIISTVFLIVLTVAYSFLDRHGLHLVFSIPWQVYSLFAFIPILFYSGKRGYNAKWFQYGCYVYFPAHLILISLIFSLL